MRSLTTDNARVKDPPVLIEEMKQMAANNFEIQQGKVAYYTIQCDVQRVFVPDSAERKMFYLACPDCKKKVFDDGRGYSCENCNKVHDTAVPTYNFGIAVADCSGNVVLNCLGEIGEAILGMSGPDFYNIHEDINNVKALAQAAELKTVALVIRAKTDDYNGGGLSQDGDGNNVRYMGVRAIDVHVKDMNNNLLERLTKYKSMK